MKSNDFLQNSRKRPFGVIPSECVLPARVQTKKIIPVWISKKRLVVLRGSKSPTLTVYRHVTTFVMDERPIHVMLLDSDTILQVAGEKGMVVTSSRIKRNETWSIAFSTSGQRKRMYELIKMWIELSTFLQRLTGFISISKSKNSVVYKCHDREDPRRRYAFKRLHRVQCSNEIDITTRVANADSLQPYLARYLFMFEDGRDNTVTVIMKYFDGGSLADRIRDWGMKDCSGECGEEDDDHCCVQRERCWFSTGRSALRHEVVIKNVLASLCIALYLLHEQNILHLDVKATNIMFDTECERSFQNLKLVDFGSSVFSLDEMPVPPMGTYGCMAPERFDGRFGPESDVYGAGIVLYHMVVGEIPFHGADKHQVMARNLQGDVQFTSTRWRRISKPLRQLAENMLNKDPDQRITLSEILKIPWLMQTHSKQDVLVYETVVKPHSLQPRPFAYFA